MKSLAIKYEQWCLLVSILVSMAFGNSKPEKETRDIKAALGCILTADWARQDLRELGLKPGTAALIRYTTAPIPGTSTDSGGLLKIFVYDRREKHAWLMFSERHDDGFLVVHNAYRLARSGKGWTAGEGNGGIATYEAIGKFASHVYETEPGTKMTVKADEHACPVRD